MNSNPNINLAGIWVPSNINQLSKNFSGSIASPFQGFLKIGATNKYSVLVTGWNATGLDLFGNHIVVNVGLFAPDDNGNLYLKTSQYIPDPSTFGAGSVVVADFNGDGLDDVFLAAHSENPMLPAASIAYIQNNDGTFEKINIGDQLVAHDAQLIFINSKPMVLTTTFDASNQTTFSSANPIYFFEGDGFKTLFPKLSWMDLAYLGDGSKTWLANLGMSSVIDEFGINGQLKLIRGDNSKYSSDFSKLLSFDISVYNFDPVSGLSNIAEQRITPYLSTLKEYENYNSSWGPGITHTYRVWSEDLNHDGHLDIMAAQSMWNPNLDNWPNALQLLINDGEGFFIDQTGVLNPDMSLNTEEFSYTPLFIDLDNSGINSYIFTNHANLGYERQTNYVLLNDGTGKIHVALHDQFLTYSKLVSDFLFGDVDLNKNYTIYEYPYGNTISFIPNPQPDGAINFLAQISASKTDGSNQQAYVFFNLGLQYNPLIDFKNDLTIADRNQSKIIRTWAGNDIFRDTNSNPGATKIDGGLGIDVAIYTGKSSDYNYANNGGAWTINISKLNAGTDTLKNIERIHFSDKIIAIDLEGNAGITAKILGAVFGKESVNNKNYVGIGLNYLDSGWTYDKLAGVALDAAGVKTNDQIVSLLWANVIETKPTAEDKQPFIAMLENGMTAGALAQLAADTSFNTTNINLVGLAQTGIEYIPVG